MAKHTRIVYPSAMGSEQDQPVIAVDSARSRIITGIPGYQREFDVTPELAQKADGLLSSGKVPIAVVRDGRIVIEIHEV